MKSISLKVTFVVTSVINTLFYTSHLQTVSA